jgi:hypothetical protein
VLPPPDIFFCRKSEPVWQALLAGTGGRRREAETDDYDPSRPAFIGGLDYGSDRLLARALREAQAPFFFVDRAYFKGGPGSGRFRVVMNAYHETRVWSDLAEGVARFNALGIRMMPRQTGGEFIYVCPSSPKHHRFFGCPDWADLMIERLRALTDRPIVLRQKGDGPPLAHLMKYGKPYAVVSYASNAAVEAICWGVPVYTEIGGARPVSNPSLKRLLSDDPFFPDDDQRMAWAASLALSDFTPEEMRNGYMWERLNARLGL